MKTKLLNLVTGAALTIPLLIHISANAQQEEDEDQDQEMTQFTPSESAVESQIEGILRHNPGSFQISPTEVQMSDGAVMKVGSPTRRDVQLCPTNHICLNEDKNFSTWKGELFLPNCPLDANLFQYKMSDGRHWADKTSSIRNAMPRGQARFWSSDGKGGWDLVIALNAGHYLKDLRNDTSLTGGNANDKIDRVTHNDC